MLGDWRCAKISLAAFQRFICVSNAVGYGDCQAYLLPFREGGTLPSVTDGFRYHSLQMTLPVLQHITSPRLLFYAVNGLGLGHVTRMLAIARAVRILRPGAQILFVTTTEADHVIYREGFASVKIPSRTIIQRTGIQPGVYNKLAQTVVMNTVAAYNPAILIADTFPVGASQELLPTLSWNMRRVFVYRAQIAERAADTQFQTLLTAYDLAIIPHEIDSETLPLPPTLRPVWTGPILIRNRAEALSKVEARRRLGLPDNIEKPSAVHHRRRGRRRRNGAGGRQDCPSRQTRRLADSRSRRATSKTPSNSRHVQWISGFPCQLLSHGRMSPCL